MSTASAKSASSVTTASKVKAGRSPSYPALDLEAALEKARLIYAKEGQSEAHYSLMMKHMGYSAKTGVGRLAFAALRKFGLIRTTGEGEGRHGAVTDDAMNVLIDARTDSPERLGTIRKLAMLPAIHQELWRQYRGNLPSDENLAFMLRSKRGFSEAGTKDFLAEFRSTLAFAQIGPSTIIPGSEPKDGDDSEDGEGANDPRNAPGGSMSTILKAAPAPKADPQKPPSVKQEPVRLVLTLGENALEVVMRSRVSKKQFENIKALIALSEETFVDPSAK